MATTWIDREPEDWEDEIPGRMARRIEEREELVEEIASETETQDEFILEDAWGFLQFMRDVFPEAVRRYIRDNYTELKDYVKEQKLFEEDY